MTSIEQYSFGRMIIDGTAYSRDLLILPDKTVLSPWWRKDGHRLAADDLTELLAAQPEVIIAGTGSSGLMRPETDLVQLLARKAIEFIALPTGEAAKEYNRLAAAIRVGGCFHLTC